MARWPTLCAPSTTSKMLILLPAKSPISTAVVRRVTDRGCGKSNTSRNDSLAFPECGNALNIGHGFSMSMKSSLREHWPEYLIELSLLGVFMLSVGLLITVLE